MDKKSCSIVELFLSVDCNSFHGLANVHWETHDVNPGQRSSIHAVLKCATRQLIDCSPTSPPIFFT